MWCESEPGKGALYGFTLPRGDEGAISEHVGSAEQHGAVMAP
jgi:hypothetical protein